VVLSARAANVDYFLADLCTQAAVFGCVVGGADAVQRARSAAETATRAGVCGYATSCLFCSAWKWLLVLTKKDLKRFGRAERVRGVVGGNPPRPGQQQSQ
jgi:hypothetical protein